MRGRVAPTGIPATGLDTRYCPPPALASRCAETCPASTYRPESRPMHHADTYQTIGFGPKRLPGAVGQLDAGDPGQLDRLGLHRSTFSRAARRARKRGPRGKRRWTWRCGSVQCTGGTLDVARCPKAGRCGQSTFVWSGGRDSNPRHPAWKASALPSELPPPKGSMSAASTRIGRHRPRHQTAMIVPNQEFGDSPVTRLRRIRYHAGRQMGVRRPVER